MKPTVFVPAHITGFFEVVRADDPLRTGSRGSGVVLDRGVETSIKVRRSEEKTVVRVNGKREHGESVSLRSLEILREITGFREGVSIHHRVDVPIGCGFGASAACALGSVLAVVRELELPVTVNTAGSVAHRAEVELGTGLGDLIAEMTGGIVIRTREGPPGYGRTDRIIDRDLYVLTETLGELDTASVIGDEAKVGAINRMGAGMIRRLLREPTPGMFMELSREFATGTSLITPELIEPMEALSEGTLGASMAMLGNTVFALSEDPDAGGCDVYGIDFSGARFL